MANEAVKVEGEFIAHDFTVVDGTTISGMTICYLSGGRMAYASIADGSGYPFAGIAATDKLANDGSTNLGCFTTGIFDLTAGVAVSAGNQVVLSGANTIRPAVAGDLLTGAVIGVAMEEIAVDAAGEVKVGGI